MLQQHRRIDGRDFFWLANNAHDRKSCTLTIRNVRGRASIWDCETGAVQPVHSTHIEEGSRIPLTFGPHQAYWLAFEPSAPPITKMPPQSETIIATIKGPWRISVNMSIQPPLEHPLQPPAQLTRTQGDLRQLAQWQDWGLKGFSGYIDYRKTIDLENLDGTIVIDLGKAQHMAQVWTNGKNCGMRLWPPFEFDITKALIPGKNNLHIRVGNLVNDSYNQPNESGLFGPIKILQKHNPQP
jgi:hypothetical protein